MEMQLILPPLFALIFGVVAFYFTARTYINNQYAELGGITVGFLVIMVQPASLLFFVLYPKEGYSQLAIILGQISILSIVIGFLIIWYSLYNLSGKKYHWFHYILVITALIGLGYVIRSFRVNLVNGTWNIYYEPGFAYIIPAIPLMYFVLEILILVYSTYGSRKKRIASKFMLTGWIVVGMSIFVMIIERMYSGSTLYYLLCTSSGLFLISLGFFQNPYSIVPNITGAKYLNISLKSSGVQLVEKTFQFSKSTNLTSELFSSAMKAIVDMLGELTGRKDIPREFGYADYKIMFEETDLLICYLICYNPMNPIRTILKNILVEIEMRIPKIHHFEKSVVSKMHQIIDENMELLT